MGAAEDLRGGSRQTKSRIKSGAGPTVKIIVVHSTAERELCTLRMERDSDPNRNAVACS